MKSQGNASWHIFTFNDIGTSGTSIDLPKSIEMKEDRTLKHVNH